MMWLTDAMDWLTDNKIPVGKAARIMFDWLKTNGRGFFQSLSQLMQWLIDSILWLLQTPHPLVIIGIFVAITVNPVREVDSIEAKPKTHPERSLRKKSPSCRRR